MVLVVVVVVVDDDGPTLHAAETESSSAPCSGQYQ